ncbi:hypothetical protein Syun_029339 [Stephania yunnanensis]|uniref:CCHC-type domain-containing protein n=1 Tax=Stephania yunnanensis TaxID=152371 RepID=A0AAP0E7T0_9MAGN
MQNAPLATMINKIEEDKKIKALINTWQIQDSSSRAYQCFGGFMDGRMSTSDRAPPASYICHRCNIQGHFIRDCPTNGDPNYDIKKLKLPTGIPKSMLMTTSDGSYALTGGVVAALKPDEATFEMEIEGLPSTRSAINIPAELHCPLCKRVMKDVVMTGKCCYRSFCDKCIRDCIISKSMCACGATNILADDLVPNKNVRDLLESYQLAKPPLSSHSVDLKRKREIEHIFESEFAKARDIGIEDFASSKLACVCVSSFASFLLVYYGRVLLLLFGKRALCLLLASTEREHPLYCFESEWVQLNQLLETVQLGKDMRETVSTLLILYKEYPERKRKMDFHADVTSSDWLKHSVCYSTHRAMRISRQIVRHPNIAKYLDEATLIPRDNSVIVHRVPRGLRKPIVIERKRATFEMEIEGLPSTRSAIDIPAELHCPLCKRVMKDAVMTGKCCYRSFCDKCIRDCIISKSMCACGATNILADDLVPNKNVRDLLESYQLAKPPLLSHYVDLKRKREIEHIFESEFAKARDIGIEDVASSKLACVCVSSFASFLLMYYGRVLPLLFGKRALCLLLASTEREHPLYCFEN